MTLIDDRAPNQAKLVTMDARHRIDVNIWITIYVQTCETQVQGFVFITQIFFRHRYQTGNRNMLLDYNKKKIMKNLINRPRYHLYFVCK